MKSKTIRQPTKAEKLRERVEHLSVDLEYSSREGNSAYTQLVNKKLDRLYNMLDRIVSRGSRF
jgi:pyrroloquinoline quinone (PQQ) biosynthesis protein C